jgi:Raf kinase inhibitor-like YbhB/YbcL family protein
MDMRRDHSAARDHGARLAAAFLLAAVIFACGDPIGPTASPNPVTPGTRSLVVPSGTHESATAQPSQVEATEPEPTEPEPTEPQTSGLPASFGSPAFTSSRGLLQIPSKYTCDGVEVSPPLEWSVPGAEGISEFAIVVTDPDARGLTHWVVARIPGTATGLDEGAGDPNAGNGLLQGRNSMGGIGYRGPCPPAGTTHHYHFALYGFASAPDLSNAPTADDVRKAGGAPLVEFDAAFGH